MKELLEKYHGYLPSNQPLRLMKQIIRKAKKMEEKGEDYRVPLGHLHSMIEDWFTVNKSDIRQFKI